MHKEHAYLNRSFGPGTSTSSTASDMGPSGVDQGRQGAWSASAPSRGSDTVRLEDLLRKVLAAVGQILGDSAQSLGVQINLIGLREKL